MEKNDAAPPAQPQESAQVALGGPWVALGDARRAWLLLQLVGFRSAPVRRPVWGLFWLALWPEGGGQMGAAKSTSSGPKAAQKRPKSSQKAASK